MNMISQINAFEDWLEYNELGAGPQLLWYKLLRVANRSGWQSELSIPNTRLQSMTKSTEKTLINHRNQLIQCGLLTYKKRGRTKAGIYILTDLTTGEIPVTNTTTGNIPVVPTAKPTVNIPVVPTVKPTVDVSAYVKQDETKLNETKDKTAADSATLDSVSNFWEQNGFGMLAPKTRQDLEYWVKDFQEIGASEENAIGIVIHALGIAVDNGARRYNYINTILKDWESRRFLSVDQIKAEDTKPKQASRQNYGKPYKTESVTNWDEVAPPVETDPALEAELDRQLAEFYQEGDSQ